MLYLALKRPNGTFRPMLAVNVSKILWNYGFPMVTTAISMRRSRRLDSA